MISTQTNLLQSQVKREAPYAFEQSWLCTVHITHCTMHTCATHAAECSPPHNACRTMHSCKPHAALASTAADRTHRHHRLCVPYIAHRTCQQNWLHTPHTVHCSHQRSGGAYRTHCLLQRSAKMAVHTAHFISDCAHTAHYIMHISAKMTVHKASCTPHASAKRAVPTTP